MSRLSQKMLQSQCRGLWYRCRSFSLGSESLTAADSVMSWLLCSRRLWRRGTSLKACGWMKISRGLSCICNVRSLLRLVKAPLLTAVRRGRKLRDSEATLMPWKSPSSREAILIPSSSRMSRLSSLCSSWVGMASRLLSDMFSTLTRCKPWKPFCDIRLRELAERSTCKREVILSKVFSSITEILLPCTYSSCR